MNEVEQKILSQSKIADEMVNQNTYVWRSAIDEKEVIEIMVNGNLADRIDYITNYFNFNDALGYQYKANIKQGLISQIDNEKTQIDEIMKKLNNPPNGFGKSYDIVFGMYGTYSELISLAESPQGSLVSYSQKTNDLFSQILKNENEYEVSKK
jgi:hypothetical protein